MAADGRESKNGVAVRRNATETVVPVWAIDKLEPGSVLGRTYRKAAGLKLDEMDDESCSATTFGPDTIAMVRWRAVSARAKRNRSGGDLLSKHVLDSLAEA
jgi:hypothetical protein